MPAALQDYNPTLPQLLIDMCTVLSAAIDVHFTEHTVISSNISKHDEWGERQAGNVPEKRR